MSDQKPQCRCVRTDTKMRCVRDAATEGLCLICRVDHYRRDRGFVTVETRDE